MFKFFKIFLLIIMVFGFNVNFVSAEEVLLKNAKAGLLMEVETGTIIYEKNIHEKMSVASMTNIMTTCV